MHNRLFVVWLHTDRATQRSPDGYAGLIRPKLAENQIQRGCYWLDSEVPLPPLADDGSTK